MNKLARLSNTTILLALLAAAPAFAADPALAVTGGDALHDTISKLDGEVFDAFNHCKDPAQLRKHASHFAEDVEFYHDTGGVTWTRDAMLANTEKHACGNYRRELVPGSMKVYTVKGFGAISQGVHRFCQVSDGSCDGRADFVIVWHLVDDHWQITRVLSYGHRVAAPEMTGQVTE